MSIICASIMCADQMKLKEELEALEVMLWMEYLLKTWLWDQSY